MALSGSFGTNVGDWWRLQLEWSATQNVAANTSTVTTKLYWMGRGGRGATYSSVNKTGSTTIDGTAQTFSGVGLAKLNNGEKKLIHTHSKLVSHNSDGSKSISLSAFFNAELDLSNVRYNRINVSGTATLNTIPRASSLSSSASWTAGSNRSISISRASSAFTHTARILVNGTLVKTITGIGASTTANFTLAENTNIFNILNGASSRSTEIQILTYSGGSHVGTSTQTGTVSAPASSTTSWDSRFNIGDTVSGNISRNNGTFRHTIQLIFGGQTFTLHDKTTATSWTYNTSGIAASLYNLIPNAKSMNGYIRIYTYYNNVQVQGYRQSGVTASVVGSNPTFSTSQISYRDVKASTIAVTGNNQVIIQGLSDLQATVATAATARNGASMSSYEITINGKMLRRTAVGTTAFGAVDASSNITMTVRAIDSRGNFTEVSKVISMIAYSPPVFTTKALREAGFNQETTIFASGNFSPLRVNNVDKNAVEEVRYRFKQANLVSYGGWITMARVASGTAFNVTPVTRNFDTTQSFDIQIEVRDKFSTVTNTRNVPVGRPIFFIDHKMSSIAFNDLPKLPNTFQVNGQILFGPNLWASGATGDGIGGGIDMNNGDIVRANGIFFNDVSNNGGEGLLFIRTGQPEGSPSTSSYDNLYVRDGVLYLNNGSGQMAIGNHIDMANNDLLNVNKLTFNDPGANEGIEWLGGSGWKIYESSNNLDNTSGNLQFVVGNTRLFTMGTTGDLWIKNGFYPDGNIVAGGNVTGTIVRGGNVEISGNSVERAGAALGLFGNSTSFYIGTDATGGRLWSMAAYDRTYSGAANLYITSAGTFGRSTSASKYKINITEVDEASLAEKILTLKTKKWFDKAAAEALAQSLSGEEGSEDIPYLKAHHGLIAEDLVKAGLEMFVQYGEPDENGNQEVEGIEYDRLWVLLIPLVREQQEQIKKMEKQRKAKEKKQQKKIDDLEARLAALEEKFSAL